MKTTERKRIILFICLFVLVLGGEGFSAYYLMGEMAETRTALAALDKEEKDAEKKIEGIPALRERSAELAAIIEEYAAILPSEKEVRFDAFLVDIDNFRRDTEVRILNAAPEKTNEKKDPKMKAAEGKNTFVRHRYRFTLEGTFLGFLRFVNKIENHPRFLRIDEVTIAPKSNKGKDGKGTSQAEIRDKEIELVISTYTYSKESTSSVQEAK